MSGSTYIMSDSDRDPRGATRAQSYRIRGTTSGPEAFDTELLHIIEIDGDERIVARVVFDLDDIDAAFEELDARYLAGEAAAHAHTWSVIARASPQSTGTNFPSDAGLGEPRPPARGVAFTPGDMTAYIHATVGRHAGLQQSTSKLSIG